MLYSGGFLAHDHPDHGYPGWASRSIWLGLWQILPGPNAHDECKRSFTTLQQTEFGRPPEGYKFDVKPYDCRTIVLLLSFKGHQVTSLLSNSWSDSEALRSSSLRISRTFILRLESQTLVLLDVWGAISTNKFPWKFYLKTWGTTWTSPDFMCHDSDLFLGAVLRRPLSWTSLSHLPYLLTNSQTQLNHWACEVRLSLVFRRSRTNELTHISNMPK